MAYDPDCTAYWCNKCGKEMTIAVTECSEDVLVLKCQGNAVNQEVGCGAHREFNKVEPHECPHRMAERLEREAEEARDG